MALAYLLDPQLQISDKSGALNVAGFLRVYLNGTDDRATTYKDFEGTLNTSDIVLDNNGRAVVIADSSKAYRLEVYTRDGDLLWTQYPLNTLVGGAGGASGLVLESSDGTVDITRYSEGGLTHYDLSTDVSDSTELLDWVKCAGNTLVPTNIYRPVFVDGTMELGDYGIMLSANQYYHVTIHIDCTKVNTGAFPWTDDVRVRFRGRDILTGEFVDYQTDKVNVDYSLMLPETKELSLDVMPATDVELVVVIDDAEITGAGFSIKDMQVHRVYSGAPHLPHGTATRDWVEANFQETLTPGTGITIDSNNVISATGGGGGSTYTAGANIQISDQNVISATDTTYSAGSGLSLSSGNQFSVDETTIQHKLTAGSGITIQNNVISASGGGGGSLPGYVFTLPEYTYSGQAVRGWSWTDFRATIDANVASGTPMMLIRQSHGNHPAGETAFYYHAINDYTISTGWIYVFGTVAASTSIDLDTPRNMLRASQHVTYQFYEGSNDRVIVRILESNLIQCPSAEDTYSGDALTIYHDSSTSTSGFAWKNLHEFVDIQVDYTIDRTTYSSYVLRQDVSDIWNTAYNAVIYDRTPRIRLSIANSTQRNDWLMNRQNLVCSYTDINTIDSPNMGTIEFTGTYFNRNGSLEETWICVLNRASSSSTPTIAWKKQTQEAHTWDPSNP